MNRSSMRTLLSRRLQDTAATTEWSDAEKNELLNLGLLEMQERILEVDPGAFLSIDTFDQVASQERYDKPAGFLYEYELAIADSAQPTGWRALPRHTYQQTRSRLVGTTVSYASFGRWFFMSPIPPATVNEGLRLTWVYSLSMAADADVPLVVLPLHNTIVDLAYLIALTETAETEAYDRVQARIEKKMEKLPTYYRRSRVPVTLTIEVRDQARRRLPRDVYQS